VGERGETLRGASAGSSSVPVATLNMRNLTLNIPPKSRSRSGKGSL